MATLETQKLDEIISSRRRMLALGGAALAGLVFAPKAEAQAAAVNDFDILNFALNLEYLEAQFYSLAYNGVTIDQSSAKIPVAVNGGTAGTVILKPNFAKVPFSTPSITAYAQETALEEGKHVSFLQSALGTHAVSMPNIDLYNSFNALAGLAGIGSFDPFASESNFLIGAYIFEDVGVTAYGGAAYLISDKKVVLPAAAGILAVEAYHAGAVRTGISYLDGGIVNGPLSTLTQKISAARSSLAKPPSNTPDDIGVGLPTMVALNGSSPNYPSATLVNADSNSITIARTTTQILSIVTGNQAGVAPFQGAFFPQGLNGTIK